MPQQRKTKRTKLFTRFRSMPGWLAWCLARLTQLIAMTCRVTFVDRCGALERRTWPCIAAIWHNRVLFVGAFIPKSLRQDSAVLVSSSRDGEYATAFARKMGLQVVRGSSSRGGAKALIGLRGMLRSGSAIVLTVDGPRGPKYAVKPGVPGLAVAETIPVLPVSINAPRRWELRSWDGTQIPKPFSRVEVVFGEMVHLVPEAYGGDREAATEAVRLALLAITDDARR